MAWILFALGSCIKKIINLGSLACKRRIYWPAGPNVKNLEIAALDHKTGCKIFYSKRILSVRSLPNWYSEGLSYVVPRLWIRPSDKTWKLKCCYGFIKKRTREEPVQSYVPFIVHKNIFLHRCLRIHRFDVLMAVVYSDNCSMWYITPYSLGHTYYCVGETWCLHLYGASLIHPDDGGNSLPRTVCACRLKRMMIHPKNTKLRL